MPHFSPKIRKTVFFLFGPNAAGEMTPGGSGVLIGYSHPNCYPEQSIMRDCYAVCCRHVVEQWFSNVRVNTKDGGSRLIGLDPRDWQFSENDLAIADITDLLTEEDDIALIPTLWLASRDHIEHYSIDVGEDGFMLGLFSTLPGKTRNIVAGRFGNLSLIAQDDFPVQCSDGKSRPAHIFDLKSRPGFSGSPSLCTVRRPMI